jgi:hypothetical protein
VIDLASVAKAGAQRLVSDIESPLGLTVRTTVDSGANRRLRIALTVDSVSNVGGSIEPDTSQITDELVCYELARLIQEGILTETGRVWPGRSADAQQPLVPGPTGWCDIDTGEHVLDYGKVRWAPGREPLPEDELRWWIDYLDFGVIASSSGDLGFTYVDIQPDAQGNRPTFSAGQRLGYTVTDASRGLYRAATAIVAG